MKINQCLRGKDCPLSYSHDQKRPRILRKKRPRKRVTRRRHHCNHSSCVERKSQLERTVMQRPGRRCGQLGGNSGASWTFRQNSPSEMRKVTHCHHALERARSSVQSLSLKLFRKPCGISDRCPLEPPRDQTSTAWNEEPE